MKFKTSLRISIRK